MVMERPSHGETPMEVEPAEVPSKEYVHMGRMPVEAEPIEVTPAGGSPGSRRR